jgi:hypothetical protein
VTVYIGRPGSLVALRSPRKGLLAQVTRASRARDTLGGGRTVDYAPRVLRTWQLNWSALTHEDQSTLMSFFAGHNGPGPWVLLDGAERNLLTVNQSSATSAFNDTSGFSASGAGVTLASTATTFDRGPRSLAWNIPTGVTSTLTVGAPNASWPGIPVVAGQAYRFQARVKGGGADGTVDLTPLIRWLDVAGADLSVVNGTLVTTSTGAFSDLVVASTVAPAGAAYALPRVQTTGASVTASATVWIDKPMLSMPTARDPGTVWTAGLGVARVSIPNLDHQLQWINSHGTSLTILEV